MGLTTQLHQDDCILAICQPVLKHGPITACGGQGALTPLHSLMYDVAIFDVS
jgi:hypothetical protein